MGFGGFALGVGRMGEARENLRERTRKESMENEEFKLQQAREKLGLQQAGARQPLGGPQRGADGKMYQVFIDPSTGRMTTEEVQGFTPEQTPQDWLQGEFGKMTPEDRAKFARIQLGLEPAATPKQTRTEDTEAMITEWKKYNPKGVKETEEAYGQRAWKEVMGSLYGPAGREYFPENWRTRRGGWRTSAQIAAILGKLPMAQQLAYKSLEERKKGIQRMIQAEQVKADTDPTLVSNPQQQQVIMSHIQTWTQAIQQIEQQQEQILAAYQGGGTKQKPGAGGTTPPPGAKIRNYADVGRGGPG
jgi:hypothetical protein